jgi:TetR/AcrR family transcriptional regulator, mexJK operon transcriptional repressor
MKAIVSPLRLQPARVRHAGCRGSSAAGVVIFVVAAMGLLLHRNLQEDLNRSKLHCVVKLYGVVYIHPMNTSSGRATAPTHAPETRSERKRRAIMAAATRLFLERGYDGTSMEDVAATAAVSKPTVYNHFADKRQLYGAIVQETVCRIDEVVALVARSCDGDRDIRSALEGLAAAFLTALMQPDVIRLRRLVIGMAQQFPEVARSWYDSGFGRVLCTLADTFLRERERGTLRFDDAMLVANHFVGLLLWIPVNEAMFGVSEELPSRSATVRQAKLGVEAFLRGYGQSDRSAPPKRPR